MSALDPHGAHSAGGTCEHTDEIVSALATVWDIRNVRSTLVLGSHESQLWPSKV